MKKFFKFLLTLIIVIVAVLAVLSKYWDYVINPWTRDGQVRAKVIQITPRVSGPIVSLNIIDNQFVNTGDLLFEIDPRTYKANLAQAQAQYDAAKDQYEAQQQQVEGSAAQTNVSSAQILQAQSAIKELDAQISKNKAEYERQKELLPKRATSQKSVDRAKADYKVSLEKRKGALASLAQANAQLMRAEATLAQSRATLGAPGDDNASLRKARAALDNAILNLEFTQIRAPVDGYVTNLNLQLGSQSVANHPALALVDINTYWIDAFFKETLVGQISKNDPAIVTMMSYPDQPIDAHVDSIGWGIAKQDGSTGFELLPNVSPTFQWIRLAQRIPVRIHLDHIPDGVALRVGSTASVLVKTDDNEDEAQ